MRYIEKHLNKEEYIGFLKGKILEYFMADKKNTVIDIQDVQQYAKQLEELYQEREKVCNDRYKNLSEKPSQSIESKYKLAVNTTKLTPNEWYDASLFTKEKLELLLPIGTLVEVLKDHIADTWSTKPLQTEETKVGKVKSISKGRYTKIFIERDGVAHYWFRIVNQQEK